LFNINHSYAGDKVMSDDSIEAPLLDAVRNPALRGVTADVGAGVVGVNHQRKSLGLLGGSDRVFRQNAGVYGESEQQGVFGHSTSNVGTGVYGNSVGPGFGVRGDCTDGIAVQGESFGKGLAGKFIGNVDITGDLFVQGRSVTFFLIQSEILRDLLERVQALEQQGQRLRQDVDGLKKAPPPAATGGSSGRQISVQKKDGKFVVTGSGFLSRVTVTIRVVAGNDIQNARTFPQSSESDGKLNFTQTINCVPGVVLHFSATDGTLVSGNTLWSNTVDIVCG
jgi:hypothetical protein